MPNLKLANLGQSAFSALAPFLVCLGALLIRPLVWAADWPGVDETVVEKYAVQAHHPPAQPLIDMIHGDLGLFVFMVAGLIGGFVAGYYFRELFPPNRRQTSETTDV